MAHEIRSIEELERVYASPPSPRSLQKETPVINGAYRRLIEAAPFAVVASRGPEGLDASPRGDGPGFIRILDEKRIAIADRRGNNRLDTLRNIVRTGDIALLVMIPGWNETLRINGTAILSVDPELLASFTVQGKEPASVIVISIETMYFQCARALIRSRLWHEDAKVDPTTLPSAGALVQSVVEAFDGEAYDKGLHAHQAETLY